MTRKTKIIATIGPASADKALLAKLIGAGMNVARLNMSHGTAESHFSVIKTIRSLSREMDLPVAILMDLQGPKIRTGTLEKGMPLQLEKNQIITIATSSGSGSGLRITTSYKRLARDVKKNDTILIDDGLIALTVLTTQSTAVTCRVIHGGLLKEHKGINLPGVAVSAPSLSAKDIEDVALGMEAQVDYIALSFVRSANDCLKLRKLLDRRGSSIPLIAKIEKSEAIEQIDDILKVSDGIMVARGDLGVEMNLERVPALQKILIKKANAANKIVITATQMLESMCEAPIPTRAEASDVANALYDGTDAVMLSAETASGAYPLQTVQTMARIAEETEKTSFMKYHLEFQEEGIDKTAHAIAQSAVELLEHTGANALINFSWSGKTAKLLSRQRPDRPVYAFTPVVANFNRMSMLWGITPLLIEPFSTTQALIAAGEKILIQKKLLHKGDMVVLVTGRALISGSTNLIKLHHIGAKD
ncbi:MAG: pyruvate kinase [Chitinivibrionales bacterium]|nr:pyruvate kinase [Chitinivibrionales bacterium]